MKPDVAEIWSWLDEVPDPEIPVISIVDLGIVRDVAWQDGTLDVALTPTYSGCPATAVIAKSVQETLERRGVSPVTITTRIAPAWTTDWLSEKGRAKLEEYGIAAPQAAGRPERCPQCHATQVEKVSHYGSTPCKAQWRCTECLEPFDYFKCI